MKGFVQIICSDTKSNTVNLEFLLKVTWKESIYYKRNYSAKYMT
jgi:hypothetical protein